MNNYSNTRDVYVEYRKSGYSKKFFEEHREEIQLHKAAKDAFNQLGVKKLPSIGHIIAQVGSQERQLFRKADDSAF